MLYEGKQESFFPNFYLKKSNGEDEGKKKRTKANALKTKIG
jgi:hypothetical protein